MIGIEYVRQMARYNSWQNDLAFAAADTLTDGDRKADRGAFFGSIHGTLTHILWGDMMWMSRFDGWEKPDATISESAAWQPDWASLKAARRVADERILDWAGRLTEDSLGGRLDWVSGATGRRMTRPMALCVAHFFNHQTHHRGQVHALLTGAGAAGHVTDLVFMPDE